jgi:hypothetical protein
VSTAQFRRWGRKCPLARRFTTGLAESKEFGPAWDSLHTTKPTPFAGKYVRPSDVDVRLLPREWSDLWRAKRRVSIEVFHPNGPPAEVWGEKIYFGSGVIDSRTIEFSSFGVCVRNFWDDEHELMSSLP